MPVETRYMRSDQHIINGLTAYKLLTTNTNTTTTKNLGGNHQERLTIRVFIRHSDGSESYQLISASKDFIADGTYEWEEDLSVPIPQTSLVSTDAVVVRLYNLADALIVTFITEHLGATQLSGVTWTFHIWIYRTYIEIPKEHWSWSVRFGSNARNSRIENFNWSTPPPPMESKQHSGTLMRVGIF